MKRRNRLKRVQKRIYRSKRHAPYADINWEKAGVLFQRPLPKQESDPTRPSTREILHILAAAGAIGLLFVFPGAAAGVGMLVLGNRRYSGWRTRQLLDRFEKQKYVSVSEHADGKITVSITEKGMTRALTYELETLSMIKPKRWDKKWRIVIFDIPEKHKGIRDIFRMRLRQLGLFQLQESVYVSPYPCFDEVEFLRELYGVAFTARYLLAEKIEDDESLKQHFTLF